MQKLVPQQNRLRPLAGFVVIIAVLFVCLLLVRVSAQTPVPIEVGGGVIFGEKPTGAPASTSPATVSEITHTLYLPLAAASWQAPMEAFKLGVLGPFTGPSALAGAEFQAAVTMALDAIGWQIGHYRVELAACRRGNRDRLSIDQYESSIDDNHGSSNPMHA